MMLNRTKRLLVLMLFLNMCLGEGEENFELFSSDSYLIVL